MDCAGDSAGNCRRVSARGAELFLVIFLSNKKAFAASWRAMQSEMLEYELETAHDQQQRTGKPLILPVKIGPTETVEGPIAAIINPARPGGMWFQMNSG